MKEIDVKDILLNPMDKIAHEWMLVTAGTMENGYNTMTASWGHLGSTWGHGGGMPTSVVFIRPQRYTKEFVDREAYYTVSFFPAEYKNALRYLGTHSGRDEDKVAAAKLTPVQAGESVTFREASLTLVCRKLYRAPIVEEGFIDKAIIDDCYPKRDYHDMYVGEIVKAFVQD